MSKVTRAARRERKHERVRKAVSGTTERPRLNVFRSSKHIYAQIIDDIKGHTVAAASRLSKEVESLKPGANKAAARAVGKLIAQKPKDHNVSKVFFARGGYLYHGRIKELADGA